MKIRTTTLIWVIAGFIWCIFMGITFISMGLGSLFPGMNRVAQPFVCPGGQMELSSRYFQVSPVENVTTLTWYCVDEQAGTRIELNSFVINFYAGPFYGLLMFGIGLALWYFLSRWNPSKASAESRKRMAWIQTISIIVIIVGVTLFNLMPLFHALAPTPAPDMTATALANTYEELISGKPVKFNSTDKPLASWNGIPVMPQAMAGRDVNDGMYTFQVPVDFGTVLDFYSEALKSPGWHLEDKQLLGMKFTKDKSTLLVTLAPASDMQSWIVSLVLFP